MAIIRKEFISSKKEQVTIRLDPGVLRRLDLYCRFRESCRKYVVEQLLECTFRKDREFQDWLIKNESQSEMAAGGFPQQADHSGSQKHKEQRKPHNPHV
jgi:predicted transcriptional regulator